MSSATLGGLQLWHICSSWPQIMAARQFMYAYRLKLSDCPSGGIPYQHPLLCPQSCHTCRKACSARSMALPKAAALLTVSSYSASGTCREAV